MKLPGSIQSLSLPALVLLVMSIPAIAQTAEVAAVNASAAVRLTVPQLARYDGAAEGRARDTVEMVFRIYSSQEGGEALWSETQHVSVGADGKYSVFLGGSSEAGLPQTVFSGGQARWLGVSIERAAEQTRVPLASAVYAMKAADAETLGGVPAAEFVTQAQLRANPQLPTSGAISSGAGVGKSANATPSKAKPNASVTPNTVAMWATVNGSTSLVSSALAVSGNDFNLQSGTIGAVTSKTTIVNGLSAAIYGYSGAATGPVSGVTGTAASNTGSGVTGTEFSATGAVSGVSGSTNSVTAGAAGVNGLEWSKTGAVSGVSGETTSAGPGAAGVYGAAWSSTGAVYGAEGQAWSSTGGAAGVYGYEGATTGQVYGVSGVTPSTGGIGVFGSSTATSGNVAGVMGQTSSKNGIGVIGIANAAGGTAGFFVANNGAQGLAVQGGAGANQSQVFKVDASGNGAFAGNVAVTGNGSFAHSVTVSQNVTISGNVTVSGGLKVTGQVTKGSGSFKIDDPLEPEKKYLSHSFVESPDMMNVYNGNIVTDKHGVATVVLPDYFEALNRDFRYQLTVIGQFAQAIVAQEIEKNHFVIRTSKPGVKVSWQITGIRQDAYANANRIPVEEEKPAEEQGYYLHPEAFGQPASKSIAAAHQAQASANEVQLSQR